MIKPEYMYVTEHAPSTGFTSFRLYGGDIPDFTKKTYWAGSVPIGPVSWYGNDDMIAKFGEDLEGYCPLRGSKRGIESRSWPGNRRYEYEYYFAQWIGKRFAKRFKKTGKRIFFLNTKKPFEEFGHHSCDRVFKESFCHGFKKEIGEGGTCSLGESDYDEHRSAIIVRVRDKKNLSSVCLFAKHGLPEEKVKAVLKIIIDCCEIELLEEQLRLPHN